MSQRSVNNPRTTKKQENITGTAKRSAARAKPATSAASTVRKEGKKSNKAPVEMSKEERKAQRAAERAERAELLEVSDILLKRNEVYTKRRFIWGVLIGTGFVTAAISAGILYIPGARDSVSTISIIAIVLLVIAYVCIIGSFVFDIVKIAPLRREAEKQVKGMSARRRQQVLDTVGKEGKVAREQREKSESKESAAKDKDADAKQDAAK